MRSPPDAAGEALERHEWGAAYRVLADRAASGPLRIEELDALATAAYLIGRDEEAFDRWTQAHTTALHDGDVRSAARFGALLGYALGFKGDIGRASGWVERVRHLLDEAGGDWVERGYLEHGAAMCRIFQDGDVVAASESFVRAAKIADRFGDRELRTLARIGEGRCLIYLGDLAEGIAMLDEAMVSVEAGEIGVLVTGDAYCTVIDACHELFDVRRCEAWSSSFARWCEAQPDLVLYRGHCLLHRAEVLQLHGRWGEALIAVQDACRRLADPVNPLTLGGAHYVEAELHRLLGEPELAEQAYERAHRTGADPQPGLALLRLAQGRTAVAVAAIRRCLLAAEGSITRARVLGPFVEISLAAGDLDAARRGVDELGSVASELGSPLLRAQAAQLAGAVLLADGDHAAALVALRRATAMWAELDAPYDAARTRLLVAEACMRAGDDEGADMERAAARAALGGLAAGRTAARRPPAGLTDREVEVLALVATGRTNRAIADALFISEKTVTSHLTHIFTKLGVTTRTAAGAFAHEHGLVPATARVDGALPTRRRPPG